LAEASEQVAMTENLNFIAGEWLTGQGVVENRSPSDLSDLVGL
jgi:alpha-ketoglutaric semialdehyde dehydrogenase